MPTKKKRKPPRRYRLSLSSWEGIAPGASHWYVRVAWRDAKGTYQQREGEHGRGTKRTNRYNSKDLARKAGVALVRRIAGSGGFVVTEGSASVADPQETLFDTAARCRKLNVLWESFEGYNGWGCRKEEEPEVQAICDAWDKIMEGK